MLEHELKYTITKKEMDNLRDILSASKDIVSVNRGVQINYYYDTEDFRFQNKGVTIRIRQKENGLMLQIKKKNYYGEHKNYEEAHTVTNITDKLSFDNEEVYLKGHLVTDRTRHILFDGTTVDLDINYYCGVVDYELEIELPEKYDNRILEMMQNYTPAIQGKASRFISASKAGLNNVR